MRCSVIIRRCGMTGYRYSGVDRIDRYETVGYDKGYVREVRVCIDELF